MAIVQTIVVSARRSVSEHYCTREQAYTVTLEVGEGDSPRELLELWTTRLQAAVDQALGDPGTPQSFTGRRIPPPGQ